MDLAVAAAFGDRFSKLEVLSTAIRLFDGSEVDLRFLEVESTLVDIF